MRRPHPCCPANTGTSTSTARYLPLCAQPPRYQPPGVPHVKTQADSLSPECRLRQLAEKAKGTGTSGDGELRDGTSPSARRAGGAISALRHLPRPWTSECPLRSG